MNNSEQLWVIANENEGQRNKIEQAVGNVFNPRGGSSDCNCFKWRIRLWKSNRGSRVLSNILELSLTLFLENRMVRLWDLDSLGDIILVLKNVRILLVENTFWNTISNTAFLQSSSAL